MVDAKVKINDVEIPVIDATITSHHQPAMDVSSFGDPIFTHIPGNVVVGVDIHASDTSLLHKLFTTCAGGHQTGSQVVEYLDGMVVSHCINCGDRIIVSRVPGGVHYARAGTLIRKSQNLHEDAPSGELLAELTKLERSIRREIKALESTLGLTDLARQILAKRTLDAGVEVD